MAINKHYKQPAFLICAALLAVSCGGMSFALNYFEIYLKKEPIALKKSLSLLDRQALLPYKVVSERMITNEDVIKSLGTEDYIQWIVEDSEATSDDVGGRCMLFITYYKLADNVPHIPEECYAGGGFQKTEDGGVTFTIGQGSSGGAGDGSLVRKIGGNYLVFSNSGVGDWQSNREVSVLYLFRVNGSYAGGREEARLVMKGNLFSKSSYFCKVEIVFNQCESIPSKEDAVAISEKLLGVVLPVLEEEHWPDLEK